MTEVLTPPTTDVLVEPTDEAQPQTTVQPLASQNLMKQTKILSLITQIYNWQPCGLSFRCTLPIETQYNWPLFAIKITPFWLPLKFFGSMPDDEFSAAGQPGRITTWLTMKPWAWVADARYSADAGSTPTAAGTNFVEKDDMPDIAWLALHHSAWRGSISIAMRVVSNVTTQGKMAVSRLYDVPQPVLNFNPHDNRTLLDASFSSQSQRFKNASMIFDLSRATDLIVQCPYISKRPVIRTADYFTPINNGTATDTSSWIIFDIINALDASAGSTQLIVDFWIKAGPDFEFINPIPPRRFMLDGIREGTGAPEQNLYYTNQFQPVPYIFGPQGGNVAFQRGIVDGPFVSYTHSTATRNLFRTGVRIPSTKSVAPNLNYMHDTNQMQSLKSKKDKQRLDLTSKPEKIIH